MFKDKKIMFITSESPLHPGSGSDTGVVDLPIQRERYTNYPKIESSSLKGAIREYFHWKDKEKTNIVFGPEESGDHAGCIAFTEAKILFFPVKSLNGVFAWITCPYVIERFKKDCEAVGIKFLNDISLTASTVNERQNEILSSNQNNQKKVTLEEFTFDVRVDGDVDKLADYFSILFSDDYRKEKFKKSIVVLCDDDFEHFVTNSTEIITRTKINVETGTVQTGALWTEEYLPENTIMYSLVMFGDPRVNDKDKEKTGIKDYSQVVSFFSCIDKKIIQIGGNQTIGKGLCSITIYPQQTNGGQNDGKKS